MTKNVNETIDDLLRAGGFVTAASLARARRISRQAAHRHLAAAVRRGLLSVEGAARRTRYVFAEPVLHFPIAGAAEDRVFAAILQREPRARELAEAEQGLLSYAFQEMVNNAIDHSQGTSLEVRLQVLGAAVRFRVVDDGIGAFESVRLARELDTPLQAAAELTKGKVTARPQNHTGEGVFFTSKAVDRFELTANGLQLVIDNDVDDITIIAQQPVRGTRVEVWFRRPVRRTMQEVFAEWTEDFEFNRTRTVVKLFALGSDFVSRSEARRLLSGLWAFREVVVDFQSVKGIGQGFADEIFRVWQQAHPEVRLVPVNMDEPVRFFVERALRAR